MFAASSFSPRSGRTLAAQDGSPGKGRVRKIESRGDDASSPLPCYRDDHSPGRVKQASSRYPLCPSLYTRAVDPARIAELLAPFLPSPGESLLRDLSIHLDLLLRWNARLNLTAVRDPEEIVQRHFGESLFAAARLFSGEGAPQPDGHWLLDLGSGAGFPGVPSKLYAPELRLVLLEAKYRKAIFLRELARALRLRDVQVFSGRAQDYPPPPAVASLTLTLRAVERFEQVLPIAARLLQPPERTGSAADPIAARPGVGFRRLALLIGAAQVGTARSIIPDFAWADPLPLPLSSARVLLVGNTVQ